MNQEFDVSVSVLREISIESVAYNLAVGLFLNKRPQVVASCYDDRIRFFNFQGKVLGVMPSAKWSRLVSSVAIADLTGNGRQDLLSGGLDGVLRAVTNEGKPIMALNVLEPIICLSAADFDGDDVAEVVIGLENSSVKVLDNDGSLVWQKPFESSIRGVFLHPFRDHPSRVHVVEFSGVWHVFSTTGHLISSVKLPVKRVLQCTPVQLGAVTGLVVGNKEDLSFYSDQGDPLANPVSLKGRISHLVSYHKNSQRTDLIAGTTDKRLVMLSLVTTQPTTAFATPQAVPRDKLKSLVFSITLTYPRLSLSELDRRISDTLGRKVDVNLRELLLEMVDKHELYGFFEGYTFVRQVRNLEYRPQNWNRASDIPADLKSLVLGVVRSELQSSSQVDLAEVEADLNLEQGLVERTLFILIGEGKLNGRIDARQRIFVVETEVADVIRQLDAQFEEWDRSDIKL